MHKRTILSMTALVALMLVAVAVTPLLALNAQGQTDGQSAQTANDRFGMESRNASAPTLDQNATFQMFQSMRDREPLFSPLSNNNGNITGQYISFMFNPDNGTIQDYSLNINGTKTPVFTNVQAAGFKPTTWNVSGPLFTATNGNLSMFAHNDPMGIFHVTTSTAATINLSMPAGFTVAPVRSTDNNVKTWMITGNGISAGLIVNNGTVNSTLGDSNAAGNVSVMLDPGGSILFGAVPMVGGFLAENERFLLSQMANGAVEGVMLIVSTAGTTFWAATELGKMMPHVNASQGTVIVNLTPTSSMSNRSVLTTPLPAPGGTRTNKDLNTSSPNNGTMPEPIKRAQAENASGQQMWYIIAVDKTIINPDNGTIAVMINGHTVTQVNSSAELAAGNSSTYWMYKGTNSSKFVVPLPSSSGPVSIVIQEGSANSTSMPRSSR